LTQLAFNTALNNHSWSKLNPSQQGSKYSRQFIFEYLLEKGSMIDFVLLISGTIQEKKASIKVSFENS